MNICIFVTFIAFSSIFLGHGIASENLDEFDRAAIMDSMWPNSSLINLRPFLSKISCYVLVRKRKRFGQYTHVLSTEDERRKMSKIRSNLLTAGTYKQFKKRLAQQCKAIQPKEHAAILEKYIENASANSAGCSTDENNTASCCVAVNLDFKFIHIHKQVCLEISYLPQPKGIQVIIRFDGRAVFNMTVSATNPPPLCIPFVVGDICYELHDLKIEKHVFSGCALLEMRMLHQIVVHEELGCFKLPFLSTDSTLPIDME